LTQAIRTVILGPRPSASTFGELHLHIVAMAHCAVAESPSLRSSRPTAARHTMTTNREKTFSVGKYLVSPLTTLTPGGAYAPSVSIRSGHGRGTHDRVFRFVARFPTREGACRYAAEEGLRWLAQADAAPQHPPTH
jgi:hypothetical protein